ncbi:uncharacterized protein LOC128389518 [Panonychus citri]|uniref:uncharacterized protein LOC128388762 n=1 Tax=Panonychus citri TaxID=50023 RepID=UPI0023071310|nr:uncharacterized protein LOC128388762 [Panonychus citri]XP_053205096.1 uncharacterized protein LOC128389518 [Panonychus citri]
MGIDFDPILEKWAENYLLSYGIMLIILSTIKIIFHLVTIALNAFFCDTLRTKTSIPDSVSAFKAFIDSSVIFTTAIFAIMGATVETTSYITLTFYLLMTPLQAIMQIWICMKWMLLDERHSVYPLIETSLELPIAIIQLLGISVAIPLASREYYIIKHIYEL